MHDARAASLQAVRSSLRTLVYCFVASAVLELAARVVYAVIRDLSSSGATHDYELLEAALTLSHALSIAVALTTAIACARLAALPARFVLPAKQTAAKAPPYRASPDEPEPTVTVETAPQVYGLARGASVAAWGVVGVEATSFLWYAVAGAFEYPTRMSLRWVDHAIGGLSIAVELAAPVLLVVWAIRVARGLRAELPSPLPVIVLALAGGRAAFWTWRQLWGGGLPEWVPWVTTLVAVTISVGMAATFRGLDRGLGALPLQNDDVDRTAEMRWHDAGYGLERYATALKVRIAIVLFGMGLGVLAGLGGAYDLAKALVVLTPLAAAIAGIAMVVALVRYARLPEDTRAGEPALAAVGFFAAGSLAEVYTLVMLLEVAGLGPSRRDGPTERLGYAQLALTVLSLAGLISLIISFSRLATSMGDAVLVDRCRSFGALVAVLSLSAVGVRVVMTGGFEGALLVALATIVVAVVVLVRYLGLLRDLRYAMASRSSRKLA